jgi:glycogen operon protein
VHTLRARQQRNFIASLLLSQGVPMLQAGDEIGRTQRGNNNAYCQDNETSWLDWTLHDDRRALLAFTARLVALRRRHPTFRRRDFFQGRPLHGSGVRDIVWLQPDGREMTDDQWRSDHARALAVFLAGDGLTEIDARGRPIGDDHFVVMLNASHEPVTFTLPDSLRLPRGVLLVDTSRDGPGGEATGFDPAQPWTLPARSLALVRFAVHEGPA